MNCLQYRIKLISLLSTLANFRSALQHACGDTLPPGTHTSQTPNTYTTTRYTNLARVHPLTP